MTPAWIGRGCASNAGTVPFSPPGPDVYCSGCQRPLDTQERLAAAVAELVKRLSGQAPRNNAPTAGVAEAAQILKNTPGGIYAAHPRGQMPATIGAARRLISLTEDLPEVPVS